jgi:hypothetical protein
MRHGIAPRCASELDRDRLTEFHTVDKWRMRDVATENQVNVYSWPSIGVPRARSVLGTPL